MKYPRVVVLMFLSIFAQTAGAQDLAVVTTVWPPYVYEDDQKLGGMATEIVRAVLDKGGNRLPSLETGSHLGQRPAEHRDLSHLPQ